MPAASFRPPFATAHRLHPNGTDVYVADSNNHAIRVVNLETGDVSTFDLVPAWKRSKV